MLGKQEWNGVVEVHFHRLKNLTANLRIHLVTNNENVSRNLDNGQN